MEKAICFLLSGDKIFELFYLINKIKELEEKEEYLIEKLRNNLLWADSNDKACRNKSPDNFKVQEGN
jgi:hypothetical protein